MAEVATSPCEFLSWDSEFFGLRIARVQGDQLSPERADEICGWANENHISCLYLLSRLGCPMTLRTAREFGFDLVDIRMTLEIQSPANEVAPQQNGFSNIQIMPARAEDLPALELIARFSHGDSRFFTDAKFPKARSEELFANWIRSDYEGRAQQVLVALSEGSRPQGYISCHFDERGQSGQIGLLGVAKEFRGRGAGKMLVAAAMDWFKSRGATRVNVVTQGRNISAQRLYQRCGFITKEIHLWFHKWLGSDAADLKTVPR